MNLHLIICWYHSLQAKRRTWRKKTGGNVSSTFSGVNLLVLSVVAREKMAYIEWEDGRDPAELLVVMILSRTVRLGVARYGTERHATSSGFALERKIKAEAWINRLDARSASKAFAFLLFSLSFLFLLFLITFEIMHEGERERENCTLRTKCFVMLYRTWAICMYVIITEHTLYMMGTAWCRYRYARQSLLRTIHAEQAKNLHAKKVNYY